MYTFILKYCKQIPDFSFVWFFWPRLDKQYKQYATFLLRSDITFQNFFNSLMHLKLRDFIYCLMVCQSRDDLCQMIWNNAPMLTQNDAMKQILILIFLRIFAWSSIAKDEEQLKVSKL